MKLYTKNTGSNYLAQIVTLPKPESHPNADRLRIVKSQGSTIIVGLNAKEGDQYILFPLEATINKKFLAFTNSFSDPLLNADGKTKGFFNDKGRVKAVKLRGVPSEGYLCPLEQFQAWVDSLAGVTSPDLPIQVGKEFDTLQYSIRIANTNGTMTEEELICEKYVPFQQQAKGPANQVKKDKTKRFDKIIPGQFHFHIDTAQLKKNVHLIDMEDIITITEKLHGTSAIFSNILVKRKLSLIDKIAKFFGARVQEITYDNIYSSRAVIKNAYLYEEDKRLNHWYKEDIWGMANARIKDCIEPGISIYAEIVGQLPNGSWIQKGYDYGTKPGEFEIYVYRITSTNAYCEVIEFTTNQIKSYCDKYNLKMVPIHYHGPAYALVPLINRTFHEDLLEYLTQTYLEKPCGMCKNNVPAEGIVVTVERDQFTPFKLKSWAFFEGETKALDDGLVDIETQESNQ